MSKRKKYGPPYQPGHVLTRGDVTAEARASVSLDGSTQSCDACHREHVTVRLDGNRLDEVVGFGFFHLEDNGGSWFLELGGLTMSLTSRKAVPIDATSFEAGTVFQPEKWHTCGQRPMTAAERELVEAALEWLGDGSSWSMQGRMPTAIKAVRAERKEGR